MTMLEERPLTVMVDEDLVCDACGHGVEYHGVRLGRATCFHPVAPDGFDCGCDVVPRGTPSENYPGRPAFIALIELDDSDRAAIAAGALLELCMDGGEVPWSIIVHGASS